MFRTEANYKFFLKRMYFYLLPVIDLYSFCLLPNHFHLLIKVKNLDNIIIDRTKSDHEIVSLQFRKLFQSYALAYNNQESRIGSLFQTPFKRCLVDSEPYLLYLIYYIHINPQKHKFTKDFKSWNWSSFHEIITDVTTHVQKEEILNWFGGMKEFLQFHNEVQDFKLDEKFLLEMKEW